MTEVHHSMSWTQKRVNHVEEEIIYQTDLGLTPKNEPDVEYMSVSQEVPMIVVESNLVSAQTDAPMIIVGEVSEQIVCAEEEVETEAEVPWYQGPPIEHEETVGQTLEDNKVWGKRQGRVALPYLKEDISDVEVPLNDESYATFHPFPCDFCSRRFKKKANLINHMVAHQTQRPHSCNICSSRFMRKCDLVNHQKIHSYVPNRENRADIEEDFKYNYQPRKKTKKGKIIPPKKPVVKPRLRSTSSPPEDSQGFFKPTSYVDEDVKLLLEMTNRLQEKSSSSSDKLSTKADARPEVVVGSDEKKPYACHKCGRCFARESALVSHSQMHAEDTHYDCNKCGCRFFTIDLLRDHTIKKHDTPITGETSEESEAEDERGTYTGDERFGTFYCTICSLSFHRQDLLKQHKRTHAKKGEYPGIIKCNTCNIVFTTNGKLNAHLENNPNCQKHICMVCGDYFNDQTGVQKHIQQSHGRDLPPNSCTYCGKPCKDKRSLQKHYWVHSTEKKYVCKRMDCLKKFHSWARLRRHMQSHNANKIVRCTECDQVFPDRRSLISHQHSHYPDPNARKFACNECGKTFGSRSSQQIHNRIHTGERPYGCRYCWKAFADGGTLRKHERIHTGEKPYVCVACPRAFNQRVVLREHIRSHHSSSVTKPGYSTPVFLCPVCAIVASCSEELAMHLVKHSDDNTLKNRNPQSGIRSYNRRKKLNSYEYDAENEFEDADFFEKKGSETESGDSDREPTRKATNKRLTKSKKMDSLTKISKTFEAAMKNISSLVEKPIKKAKMISTKPKPPTIKKTKKGAPKGTRRRNVIAVSVSVTPVRPRTRTMSGRLSGRKDSTSETTEESRPRASRTKSAPYDANYSDSVEESNFVEKTKKTIRKPTAFQRKSMESKNVAKNISTDLLEDMDIKDEINEMIPTKPSEGYACDICFLVFMSQADLLSHVAIHI